MNTNDFARREQAWTDVAAQAARLKPVKLTELFARDAARVDSLTYAAPHLLADFSKQRIDAAALATLERLAEAAEFDRWRAGMFSGEIINTTEQRAVKHWALRAAEAPGEVKQARAQMAAFARDLPAEGQINAIVHLGIGGSDLGPRLLLDALTPFNSGRFQVRFAANVDGADVADAIKGLDPARTLLIVVSKTFTTQETLANAAFVRAWGPARIAAATAAPDKAIAWGVKPDHVFPFWDWVGGRYSLWSSVSLACVIALGAEVFERLLAGAAAMDKHFQEAPFARNLPAIAAAIQAWNREALGHGSYAMIPYSERLRLLPTYLQQLEMESNGKGVSRDGDALARPSAGVTWGAAGTNAQHSFFQLLHQGVQEIPLEAVLISGAHEGPSDHRAKLFANALAQTRALMVGREGGEPQRRFSGDRASTLMAIDALSPESLGALIAFYEHRTFTQGVLAGINSFDQFGVELGKEMANQLAPALEGGAAPPGLDASTATWLKRLAP